VSISHFRPRECLHSREYFILGFAVRGNTHSGGEMGPVYRRQALLLPT